MRAADLGSRPLGPERGAVARAADLDSRPTAPAGLAGPRCRSGRGLAGRQSVATPAGSRVAGEMTGSLFESENHHAHHSIGLEPWQSLRDYWISSLLYRKHRAQIYVKYAYIYQ